ncbi:MAG: hypothetical protein QOC98_1415 [Frankiaceae bacterium]|nr:hypothetical protein [Frankiaceae bacterium]
MSIAAGWYPDPLAPDAVRWWSGEGWTESVQQIPHQPVPAPAQPPVQPFPPQRHALAPFSPTPVVQPSVPVNPWAPVGASSNPYGYPGRPPRRLPWILGTVAVLVVVGLIVAGVQVAVSGGSEAKVAATGYLQALERGDTAAAYQDWCAADRAVYPEAMFRAQHESRAGHASRVVHSPLGASTGKVSVLIRDDEGTVKDLPLERAAGRWEVCPRGQRLQDDMGNCRCMTPTQELEADIAHVLASKGTRYPVVEVRCPTIPALVDGQPVPCTARAADGRTWAVTAKESGHASYTNVEIVPTGTVS